MAKTKPIAPATEPCDRSYTTATGSSNGQGCEVVKLLLQPKWTAAQTAYVVSVAVPGLDATLCRCADCLSKESGGIWWADIWMRDRLRKRISPYNFKDENGDLCRDKENS